MFRYGGQDVNGEAICLGEVASDKLHIRVHKGADKLHVAGETIQLGQSPT